METGLNQLAVIALFFSFFFFFFASRKIITGCIAKWLTLYLLSSLASYAGLEEILRVWKLGRDDRCVEKSERRWKERGEGREDNWTRAFKNFTFRFLRAGWGWGTNPSAAIKHDRSVQKALISHNEIANLNAEQFPRLLCMKKLYIIRNRPVLFSPDDQLSGSRKLVFSQESNFHLGIESHARSHGHRCSINPFGSGEKD